MNSLIFRNKLEFFQNFFTFLKIPFKKKSPITRTIILCDMKSYYKNKSKISNVTIIFQNFKNLKNVKNFLDSGKSIKQLKNSLVDYLFDNYFYAIVQYYQKFLISLG